MTARFIVFVIVAAMCIASNIPPDTAILYCIAAVLIVGEKK